MRAKEFALGFGVAIILPMLVHYGVSTFVPVPRPAFNYPNISVANVYADRSAEQMQKEQEIRKLREDYRHSLRQNAIAMRQVEEKMKMPDQRPEAMQEVQNINDDNREKAEDLNQAIANINEEYQEKDHEIQQQRMSQSAEENRKRQQERSNTEKHFQQILFLVSVPVGIAAILIGTLLPVQSIGAGLMWGGILTLTDGYVFYWSELQDWMRFLSLLAAFVILIFIGYRKLAK